MYLDKHEIERIISYLEKYSITNSLMEITNNKFLFGEPNYIKEVIMFLLPDIILFLEFINKISHKNNYYICFLSRDCYFLEKLYRRMYPHDNNFEYVYCSRRLCYEGNQHYISYVKNILEKRKKTIWVDIQGSGDSHIYFFKKYFNYIPPKIFFFKNSLQKKYFDFESYKDINDVSNDDVQNIFSFKNPEWRFYDKNNQYKAADYLEYLFRAPTKSIIGMDSNYHPVYKDNKSLNDKTKEILLLYEYILDKWWIDRNIKLRVDINIHNTNFKIRNNWNGLLALDINETITHTKPNILKLLLNFCLFNKVKVILITETHDPFYSNDNGSLNDITKIIRKILNYKLEIWYNPFPKEYGIPQMKLKQLFFSNSEIGVPFKKCIFIDNDLETLQYIKKYVNIETISSYQDNKFGITQDMLKIIKKKFTES